MHFIRYGGQNLNAQYLPVIKIKMPFGHFIDLLLQMFVSSINAIQQPHMRTVLHFLQLRAQYSKPIPKLMVKEPILPVTDGCCGH